MQNMMKTLLGADLSFQTFLEHNKEEPDSG